MLFNLQVYDLIDYLSFIKSTKVTATAAAAADVDSGKWNRNRNSMFTQGEMTTGMCLNYSSMLCLYILYNILYTIFICKHFVLYSRRT